MCVASRAGAVPLFGVPIAGSHLNVESADLVGAGAEVTYLIVDFRAAGGGSFAFGYRHEGMDTAQDMLAEFEANGVLDVFLEDFSFGPAVRGIAYQTEAIEDVFEGAFSGPRSWVLWEGHYDGDRVEWAASNVGINGVEFGDTEPTIFVPSGGFYGLSTSPDFPGREPLLPLPGDFDSNGFVDGDDLLLAILGFGTNTSPTLAAGDADRDGDVDRADMTLWRENAGARVPPPNQSAGIPEPSSPALAWLALWSATTCRRFLFRST